MDRLVEELLNVISSPEGINELHDVLGSFCHRWRNHLNALSLGIHLTSQAQGNLHGDFWQDMEGRYRSLERLITEFQEISRPARLTPLRLPLCAFWADRHVQWQPECERLGRTLELSPPSTLVYAEFDPTRFTQVFDTLVIGRDAPGPIEVRWWEGPDKHVRVEWHEPEALVRHHRRTDQPASLAVPLLGRLMTSHGGRLDVTEHPGCGFTLAMAWPLSHTKNHAFALTEEA